MGWETELADVVAGQPIEAAWGNTVRDKLVHVVATPAALPVDEPDGGVAYVNSTDGLYLRTDGAWVGMGRGTLGYAQITASPAAFGPGDLDIVGLSVTVTVPAGRRLKLSTKGIFNSANAQGVQLRLREGATELQRTTDSITAGQFMSATCTHVLSPTGGAHTYKVTCNAGAAALNYNADSTFPAFLLVEDIGAA